MIELNLLNSDKKAVVDASSFEEVRRYRWRANREGYIYACHDKQILLLHRVLLNVPKGDKRVVDHINGNTYDNRLSNLRVCSQAENLRNQKMCRISSTGFKGVHKNPQGTFKAGITFNGRFRHLGVFPCPAAAARAYDKAAKELHGEFARLNFPESSEVA